jgi:hypothetical protein
MGEQSVNPYRADLLEHHLTISIHARGGSHAQGKYRHVIMRLIGNLHTKTAECCFEISNCSLGILNAGHDMGGRIIPEARLLGKENSQGTAVSGEKLVVIVKGLLVQHWSILGMHRGRE